MFFPEKTSAIVVCVWIHMGLLNWLGSLFHSGGKKKPETPAPSKPSRAVPTGVKRPLVAPPAAAPKPGEHVAGELHTAATLIGKDAEYLAFQCLCGKKLKAPLAHTGKRVKCPVCARMLDIPTG